MPELPEVETVKETLKKLVLNKRINNVKGAKTTDEFEFIELCARAKKEKIINDFNSQIVVTYTKKNTK
mgnify:CR=1 FL=1